MSKTKKKIPEKLLTLLLVTVLLAYLGYQIYRSVFNTVETEIASTHSVYETIDTNGFVFRAETLIPPASGGYTYYLIENGTRVAKNSAIAAVYNQQQHGRIKEQIEEIDQQIAALRSIAADGASGRITLDVLNEQLDDSVYALIKNTDTGVFADVEEAKFSLLSLLSKRQLVTGEAVSFNDKIARLENEKASLAKNFQSAKSVVHSPVAGYFADKTDGFENIINTDELSELTVEQMKGYLTMEAPTSKAASGKIVSGYQWYLGCVVPDSYYTVLGKGNSMTIRMSFVTDEEIPVTVHSCKKDNKGNLAVIFRCDYMSEELSTIRRESVQIQLVRHTGLKVSKRAIIMDKDQQAGVYVRSGNVASFRKIKQVYSEPADYVICEEVNESGYLKMYDDVIVGGRDLYDGKIIG